MLLKKSVNVGFAIKGGNQELLAIHLDKSTSTVSKYMNSQIDPPFSVILSICEYFKVPMSEFCSWSER